MDAIAIVQRMLEEEQGLLLALQQGVVASRALGRQHAVVDTLNAVLQALRCEQADDPALLKQARALLRGDE